MNGNRKYIRLDVITLFVAVFALLASLYSIWRTEDYNRKSVVPFLVVQHQGRNLSFSPETDPLIRVAIKNNGAGVARVTAIRFGSTLSNSDDFEELLRATSLGRYQFIRSWTYQLPFYIRAGDSMPIIATDTAMLGKIPDDERVRSLKFVSETLNTFSIGVVYESLYGETNLACLDKCR